MLTMPLTAPPPVQIDDTPARTIYTMDNASGHDCLIGLHIQRANTLVEFDLRTNTPYDIHVRGLPLRPHTTKHLAIGAKGFCFVVSADDNIYVYRMPNAMRLT